MGFKLEQLIPKQVEFKLQMDDKEVMLRIGPFTARHEIWLKDTFGANLEKVFSELDGANMARIAFHAMHPEDRVHFGKRVCETVDENGDKVTESIGGFQLLAQYIQGPSEKLRLLEALTESLGVSRSLIEELEEAEKKKAQEVVETIQNPPQP
jgi:hypothetical protein